MSERILVIGGGPAGLACVLGLRSHGFRGSITLVDRDDRHVLQPLLHEARSPTDERVWVPFPDVARRLGFDFVQAEPAIDLASLREAERSGRLRVGDGIAGFDRLVVAVGSSGAHAAPPGGVDLRAIRAGGVPARHGRRMIVGGGASAIQFAGALAERGTRVTLVTADETLAPELPAAFRQRVRAFLRRHRVQVRLREFVTEVEPGALWLTGLRPGVELATNEFGQVRDGRGLLERVFAAGDCAAFEGTGFNGFAAQAAIAKGKRVAENIRRSLAGRWLRPYDHQPLGYVLPLGRADGIAWVGDPGRHVTGLAAVAMHETVATQYHALLRGVDLFAQSLLPGAGPVRRRST